MPECRCPGQAFGVFDRRKDTGSQPTTCWDDGFPGLQGARDEPWDLVKVEYRKHLI